jgi:uncharacterized protein (TIGR00730 family)
MRVCVFCGSSAGARPEYTAAAQGLGKLLADRGVGLVYGGAMVGLMGAVANGALAAGGHVIGVIPRTLLEKELAHQGISDLRVVETMHQRKAMMSDLADAFIALPGSIGTLEELFEVWTWAQLGLHRKPIGLLDVLGYYHPLIAFLDRAVTERFMRQQLREMVLVDENPETLLTRMASYEPPKVEKWIDRKQT